ncbi:FKBP-type peptidyl-prolyl cis-trans isomerase [Urechidicola vernalis]|uniref:Peptidyl-prolyl cis-trans isomerase n=1 Tax=Urechidicola vernalis TaxID=3075600 RepID=A0ABU2Y1X6_9FLAO|nr:FKBP-type peptidyl-prolyl cis-trans isomerase [Urechidicola sp. P050]MDT0552170.1 FKBP-type peptidyl-prolyl cis-trans isomerase [Urechidicola sp. P050]
MRLVKLMTMSMLVAAVFSSCNGQSVSNKSLETELDSVSYAIGLDMAVKMKANFSEVNDEMFIQGFANGIDSTNIKIDAKDLNNIISKYFMEKQQRDAAAKAEAQYGDIKKEGEAFLLENKTKEGVVTTDSGFQYIILKEGTGDKPVATDQVKVHYHGTLIDGSVFDSSVDRGEPIVHSASGFVKGFNEGIALMSVGSKYKFFIPQELGYGAASQGGPIKPFSTIIFEVELLEIVK